MDPCADGQHRCVTHGHLQTRFRHSLDLLICRVMMCGWAACVTVCHTVCGRRHKRGMERAAPQQALHSKQLQL